MRDLHGWRAFLIATISVAVWSWAAAGAAAELTVRSEVDAQKVGVQDPVQLTITLSGAQIPDNVPMPALSNLRVANGPFVSTQMSFMNGVVSQGRTYTYVLQPLAVGPAEVGEIRLKVGPTAYVAPPIGIEVVSGSVKPKATAPPDPFDPFGGEDPMDMFRRRHGRTQEPKLFIESAVNRDRAFVGEPVLLTYYLYTTISVTDYRFVESPTYAGFWSEPLPPPDRSQHGDVVDVRGERFRRFPLIQKLLFPTKAGKVVVPGSTLRIGVESGGGFFGPMQQVVERSTRPLTVTAEPIPEGAGFSGAVGRFTAQAHLDKTNVALGEAVTLRFEVAGSGNLKWIDRGPEVKVAGAKVYPPQVRSDLRATPNGLSGTKTWEFVIVPETSGALTVPALSFGFFEPELRHIEQADTPAVTFQVKGGPGAATGASRPAASGTRASGPLALRSDLDLPLRAGPALSARALAGVVGLVLAVHGALWAAPWLLDRRREASGRPAGRSRTRRAVADLERAGRDGMSKEASVALIEKTLHDVFGPLEENATGPTNDRERAAREVLQEVYFIRYAPQLGDYSEQIRSVARRAADVVRKWA
jgi:hypothetical protein